MNDLSRTFLVASIFRYLLIVAGVFFAYMGYRLFKLGYFEKAGELRAAYGGNHFLVKQVAPGVAFAALGAMTIGFAVVHPVTVAVPVSTTAVGPASTTAAGQPTPCPSEEERVTGQGKQSPKQDTKEFNKPLTVEDREQKK
jgi:hypothetical protein